MMRQRRPPSFIPTTPWSHPLMTRPAPSSNENGWPRSHDASNCSLVEYETPTYCTLTVDPVVASLPEPTVRSSDFRAVGGGASGTLTGGFTLWVPLAMAVERGPPVAPALGAPPAVATVYPPAAAPPALTATA